MSTHEQFEKWFAKYHDDACTNFGGIDCTNPKGIAEEAWQASRAATLEEGLRAVEAERLEDPSKNPDDIAYDMAVDDCADAIRALAKAEGD